MKQGTLIWDFDGTLADRPYTWSGSILAGFDEVHPGHSIQLEQIREHASKNFPWHAPEKDYLHLRDPNEWWSAMESMMVRLAVELGATEASAPSIARLARERIIDHRFYRAFDDVIPTLDVLRTEGWRHVILSNNYPDLAEVVRGMGLSDYFERIFTSALIGYEKPRPEAYRHVLAEIQEPGEVWMIGDNEVADAFGAETVGIKSVLVRKPAKTFHRSITGLADLPAVLT